MIEVRPEDREALRSLFLPDRPGPLAGLHACQTGLGQVYADRLPDPRCAIVAIGDDVQLAGDAAALNADDLTALGFESGMVDAAPDFVPILESAFPGVWRWPRVISLLAGASVDPPAGANVRRLGWDDARAIASLDAGLAWISNPWEGPTGLAGSGFAFGAFVDGKLVSVAAPFHMGERFEDIGVVTEEAYRRRGLSAGCVSLVIEDIGLRGRLASWSTTPDNAGSLAVAERFGAQKDRDDVLYIIGRDAPA